MLQTVIGPPELSAPTLRAKSQSVSQGVHKKQFQVETMSWRKIKGQQE